MSRALKRRINVRTKKGAHYVLENSLGVRLADFHPGPDHEMVIARPGLHRLYIRELPFVPIKNGAADVSAEAPPEREFAIPSADDSVTLADLDVASPRVAMRGAGHESFSLIFSPPFDHHVVRKYRFRPLATWDDLPEEPAPPADWRRPAATVAFGLGAAATAAGLTLVLSADELHTEPDAGQSQVRIAQRNDRVNAQRLASYVSFGVAGAASAAGLAFLLWPDGPSEARLSASVTPSGFALTFGSRFDMSSP